jgi:hypothetical protein
MPLPPAFVTASAVAAIVAGQGGLALGLRAAGDVHGRALRAERDRDALAGAARGAGDDGDHALEFFAHAPLLCWARNWYFRTLPDGFIGSAATAST